MVLALGTAATAPATSIVYVCGPNLCRIDPAKPKRVTHLTRDGKAGSGPVYRSPSLSTKGTRLSFVRANRRYLAAGDATRARRVDEAAGTALTAMRPDGSQVAYIRAVNAIISPGFTYPHYSPPVHGIVPFVFVRGTGAVNSQTVARATTSTGWLGDRLLFPHAVVGSGPRPEQICLLAPAGASDLCERAVATDPGGRTLSNPAASPDGRALVAVAEPFAPGKQRFAGSIASSTRPLGRSFAT
jgi:hypothetical protein